jgi:hypothetical protein
VAYYAKGLVEAKRRLEGAGLLADGSKIEAEIDISMPDVAGLQIME